MANINVLTRRKQMAVLIAVVLGLSAIGGVAWYIGTPSKAPPGKSQAKTGTGYDRRGDLQYLRQESQRYGGG